MSNYYNGVKSMLLKIIRTLMAAPFVFVIWVALLCVFPFMVTMALIIEGSLRNVEVRGLDLPVVCFNEIWG